MPKPTSTTPPRERAERVPEACHGRDGAAPGEQEAPGPSALVVALVGSAAVATAFGMARYGYGLLLPDVQEDLALGAAALGAIGTLAYVGYLAASVAVSPLVARAGERAAVVAGGTCAVAGCLVIAVADGAAALAFGVAVAGASCGLVFPPFADAAARVRAGVRDRTLATVNCGTGWGVAVAAPIAIVAGGGWRLAWVGFAVCAALSTLAAARVLPGRPATRGGPLRSPPEPSMPRRPGAPARAATASGATSVAPGRAATASGPTSVTRRARLPRLRPGAGALVATAFLIGLGSAGYWTFAVDAVREGGVGQTPARVMLGLAGVASLLGIVAADVIARLGERRTFVACVALEIAALAVVALAAGTVPAVLAAAVAFGAAYNAVVAVTVLWSNRIHADRPSAGLALAAGANGAGLLFGPLVGGVLADAVGLPSALLVAAGVLACALAVGPRRAVP